MRNVDPPRQRLSTNDDPQSLASQLARLLQEERAADAVKTDGRDDQSRVQFLDWALRVPTAKGAPLDFERFPFQREIYGVFGDQDVPEAEAMKSVQVGMSELLTRLSLFIPDVHGLTSLYVFPALKQMADFSDTRVNPLRDNSEYLQNRTQQAPWNKGLKRIGQGYAYYRGSESKNDLISVDADLVCMDEYDSLHPPHIPEAEKRVAGSMLGLLRRVGIPTDPEYGIAKRYAQSDRRQWLVKCMRCKARWQPLDFWANLTWEEDDDGVVVNPALVCHACHRPLDPLKGEWVAELPSRERPGFHIHRLMVPGERNLRMVIEDSKARNPVLVKAFWTNDLGLPFADVTDGLDRAAIAAALSAGESYARTQLDQEYLLMTPGYRGGRLVTAGIDVASVRALNVRISEHLDPLTQLGHRKRALWIGTCDSFDEVATKLDTYNVNFAVVDHLPEGRLARGLAQRFSGRVYVAHYSDTLQQVIRVDSQEFMVAVQRVSAMDATAAVMRAQRNLLPADLPVEYVEHMVAPRREAVKDEYDRDTVRWVSKGPSDYYQAETYDLLATEVAKVRIEYEKQTREEVWQLDERLEFERSRVNDPYSMDYSPGPGGDDDSEYRPGPDLD